MSGSLAYRKNEAQIRRGIVPEKYTRLLPFIPGREILEIGSAEGVLASLLARRGLNVMALEMRKDRHDAAISLHDAWRKKFTFIGDVGFVNAGIGDRLDLLDGADTLVAVRMIYYLRDTIDAVFDAVSLKVPNVVLCGNKNRAAWWRQGIPDKPGGPLNYYASHEGMRALLERHGYSITAEERDGDPIVVGHR